MDFIDGSSISVICVCLKIHELDLIANVVVQCILTVTLYTKPKNSSFYVRFCKELKQQELNNFQFVAHSL